MNPRNNAFALAIASAVLLAACAQPAPPTVPAPTGPNAERRGGTLVIAVAEDPASLNPGITTGGAVHAVADSMFNGLIEMDDNANLKPDLAASWEVMEGGRAYKINLAKGVTWHDGTAFSSADVKWTFENALLKLHARTKAGLENVLAGIETPDANTVIFRFKSPYPPFLQRLSVTETPILPKHIFEKEADLNKAAANLKPVGTGPFKFTEYKANDQTRMVRNEKYFKPGLPYANELVFRVIPDANTRTAALEKGEIDYTSINGPDVDRLTKAGLNMFQVSNSAGGGFCIMTLSFNLEKPALQNVKVRQAFAHAIDRDAMVSQITFNTGRAAKSAINSRLAFAHNPNVKQYALSADTASKLLGEAGVAKGTKLNALMFPTFSKYGDIMRQNMAAAGIDLEIVQLERAAFVTRVFEKRDFDTALISYCNGADPTIGVSRMYMSTNIGNIQFSNAAAYRNPKVDELFNAAAAEPDTKKRGELYGQMQSIVQEELPYWWLVETTGLGASRTKVKDIMPWSGNIAEQAWITK
jgi:peptide/nickel transport system substrate-binding protein